jgi:hypothetical protein
MSSWLEELKAKALGKVGKVGASVTGALNLPTAKSTGESFFASLQNLGGNPGGTFQWAKPVQATDNLGGGGGAGGDDYTLLKDDATWQALNASGNDNRTTGTTDTTGTNTDDDANTLRDLAGNEQQSAVQAILSRLQMMRDIASRNVGEARGVADEVKGNIRDTYGNLRTSAQSNLNSALSNLQQEGINVENLYGRAGGEARRAFESALTRNRMMNRAQGTLGSSFYTDAQGDTTNKAATAQSDISQEEAGKQAGLGTRTTDTKNWFTQKSTDIDKEEAGLLSDADRELQRQVNAANDMERSYGIDSEEQLQKAEGEYASKLQGIKDYIQNKQLTLMSIGQKAGGLGSAISGYDWKGGGLGDTLANTSGLDRAKSITSSMINSFGQPGGASNVYDTNLGPKTNTYEDELRRLGLLRNVA